MPDYKFLVFNSEGERANRSTRSHAMRTALQLRSEVSSSISPASSTSLLVAQSQGGLKGRFRLSPGKTKAKKKKVSSESSEEFGSDDEIVLKDTPLIAFTDHLLDPFDTIPVPSSKTVDHLTKYFVYEFKLNISTVNPKNTWFGFSLTDTILFHATLALAATVRNSSMNNALPWITRAGYYHKGVVLRRVNTQLANRQHAISDAMIGAVANLANIETLAGSFDAAETHLRGLMSLVETRGGLETFKDNFILERAITWVDMNLAVQCGRLPLFSAIYDPNDLDLPKALIESATHPPLDDLFTPGPGVPALIEVIRRLRLALLAQDEIEAIPDIVRILMICTDRSILELLTFSIREAHVSRLTRIVNSAAHVFLHGALRQVPNNSLGFHNLLRRLRENLEDGNIPKIAPSIPLLWALIIGVAATCDLPEQFMWFSSQLTPAFSIFNQQYTISRPQLEQRLKGLIWLDQFCQPGLDTLWMSDHDK